MIPWIIQMSTISLIVIALIHYLFIFFKTNLTIPKVKDLVNKPQKQYDALFNTISSSPVTSIANNNNLLMESGKTSTDSENTNMKNELKNYLKELGETKKSSTSTPNTPISNVNNNNDIMTGENIMGNNSLESSNYSSF
jgi:hypothetical protein